jgi:hypothetical protein
MRKKNTGVLNSTSQTPLGPNPHPPSRHIGSSDKEKTLLITGKERENCYILSFDGASKGNPGQAGGGGLIEKPNAGILLRYAIGLGTASNNHVEAMALWQGLCHAQNIGIRDLIIIGDS